MIGFGRRCLPVDDSARSWLVQRATSSKSGRSSEAVLNSERRKRKNYGLGQENILRLVARIMTLFVVKKGAM